jgi:hypothetical protein
MFVTRLVAGRTNNIDVEAGKFETVVSSCPQKQKDEGMLVPYSPKVYGVVRDARTNAPDHLVNTDVVNVVSRDDAESDIFVLYQISLVLCIDRNPVNTCSVKMYAQLQPVKRTAILHRMPACTLVFDKSPSSRAI